MVVWRLITVLVLLLGGSVIRTPGARLTTRCFLMLALSLSRRIARLLLRWALRHQRLQRLVALHRLRRRSLRLLRRRLRLRLRRRARRRLVVPRQRTGVNVVGKGGLGRRFVRRRILARFQTRTIVSACRWQSVLREEGFLDCSMQFPCERFLSIMAVVCRRLHYSHAGKVHATPRALLHDMC